MILITGGGVLDVSSEELHRASDKMTSKQPVGIPIPETKCEKCDF